MIIASDSIDGSRAITMIAKKYDIPVLATAHSINMFTASLRESVALADVHCFFGLKDEKGIWFLTVCPIYNPII